MSEKVLNSKSFINLLQILKTVFDLINPKTNVLWSDYDSPEELKEEMGKYITELENGDFTHLSECHLYFLPTGAFQEIAMSNCWAAKYLTLAQQFDREYKELKKLIK